jgi:hypothetical protein
MDFDTPWRTPSERRAIIASRSTWNNCTGLRPFLIALAS